MPEELHNRIAVLGAGTMGHGIAQVAAMGGYQVRLFDVNKDAIGAGLSRIRKNLQKGVEKGKVAQEDMDAALDRILGTADMEHAVEEVAFVIEAAPEKMELKQEIFARIAPHCHAETILGTNTSSLAVGEIAAATNCPDRVIGLHFFNPVHIMKLLEIIRAESTSEETVQRSRALAERMGKTSILVRDVPGFATSRLGVALGLEAIRMFEAGVASAEDIDKAMELGYKHPMGPLRLTDLVGLDVRLSIADYLKEEIGPQFEAPELMRKMVAEGKLGQKSGQGFYSWS